MSDGLVLDYDASEVKDVDDVLPDGRYIVRVEKVEAKTSKAGDLDMIALTFIVDEGDHKGRRLWASFSWRTTSNEEGKQKAVEIGRKQIERMLLSLGIPGERDVGRALGRQCYVQTKKKEQDGFEPRAEIVAFLDESGKRVRANQKSDGESATEAKQAESGGSRPGFLANKKAEE